MSGAPSPRAVRPVSLRAVCAVSPRADYIAPSQSGYIYTESEYLYTATSCSILKSCCSAESNTGVATGITGHAAVTSGDEDALKSAVGTYPIIPVGIDASSAQFQLYSPGVRAEKSCSSTSLDHGAAVVGYSPVSQLACLCVHGPSPTLIFQCGNCFLVMAGIPSVFMPICPASVSFLCVRHRGFFRPHGRRGLFIPKTVF